MQRQEGTVRRVGQPSSPYCADIVDGTIAGLNAGERAHLDGRREWHASAIDDATAGAPSLMV